VEKWNWVFEGDFCACFDTLSHDFILSQINGFPFYDVVERFLKAGYVDNNVFNPTKEGTPQGGLLSPLLANIALHGMENYLNISYSKRTDMRNGKPYESFETKGKYPNEKSIENCRQGITWISDTADRISFGNVHHQQNFDKKG